MRPGSVEQVRRRASMAVAVLVLAVLVTVGGPPAHAVTRQTAGDIVVDDAGGHVFVTAGDTVAVYDLDGEPVGSIPDQFGAIDLMLRGRTLYVIVPLANRINTIDADTLTVTGGWSVAATPRPRSMAWTAGKLWFTYADQWGGGLASLDPLTGVVAGRLASALYGQGAIAASESPARVYVLDRGVSPSKVHAYDVSTDPPTPLGQSPHSNACTNGSELALSVDGTKAWTACGSPYLFNEFDTALLAEPAVHYTANPYPMAVDRSADGRFIVGGTGSWYDPDVFVYEVGRPTAVKVFEIGYGKWLADGMVAISGDGARVYAVDEGGVFHVWTSAPRVTSITPSRVPVRTANEIVVAGSRFAHVDAVTIGGHAADFVVVSDTEVRVTTPRLRRGRYPVVLSGPAGSNAPSSAATVTAFGRSRKQAISTLPR